MLINVEELLHVIPRNNVELRKASVAQNLNVLVDLDGLEESAQAKCDQDDRLQEAYTGAKVTKEGLRVSQESVSRIYEDEAYETDRE